VIATKIATSKRVSDGRLFLAFPAVGIRDDSATVRGTGSGGVRIYPGCSISNCRCICRHHSRCRVNRATCWNRRETRWRNTVARRQNHRRIDTGSRLSEVTHAPVIALPLLHLLQALATRGGTDRYQSQHENDYAHDAPKQCLSGRCSKKLREYGLRLALKFAQTSRFARKA
jgi:hypothetical protein